MIFTETLGQLLSVGDAESAETWEWLLLAGGGPFTETAGRLLFSLALSTLGVDGRETSRPRNWVCDAEWASGCGDVERELGNSFRKGFFSFSIATIQLSV